MAVKSQRLFRSFVESSKQFRSFLFMSQNAFIRQKKLRNKSFSDNFTRLGLKVITL